MQKLFLKKKLEGGRERAGYFRLCHCETFKTIEKKRHLNLLRQFLFHVVFVTGFGYIKVAHNKLENKYVVFSKLCYKMDIYMYTKDRVCRYMVKNIRNNNNKKIMKFNINKYTCDVRIQMNWECTNLPSIVLEYLRNKFNSKCKLN